LMKEIQKRASELKKKQEQQHALASKIKMMESKLLVGGKSIIDKTTEQERDLEKRRHEIAEKLRREREMQQQLESKDESALEMKETYTSLQQEVDVKTKKLKKLFARLQQIKAEITDVQEEHVRERQELMQTQEELTRELKLKHMIIENFIPLEERTKLMNRLTYDEDNDKFVFKPLTEKKSQVMAKRPVSAVGNKRPISEYARMAAAMGGQPRYKAENIIQIELDMPNRTTRDYEGPCVAPRVQAALDAALQDEEDLTLDADILVGKMKVKSKMRDKSRKRAKRPTTAKPEATETNENQFPTARGLVREQKRF